MEIILTRDLCRDFKTTRAVANLNLNIQTGELFGLVGPDGAGKTTTLRLLAGLLSISSGQATVSGYDLAKQVERIKPRIGYMAQRFSLYRELTVSENLAFFATIYNVSDRDRKRRTAELLEFAGLSEFKSRLAAHLSGGMQKKLALACTLIHQPDLLLLDEPTTGVDPISRREFWQILTDLHLQGTTIMVSTPYMDEADRCGRVGLMYAGSLVICDTPENIRARIDNEVVEVIPQDRRAAQKIIEGLCGVSEVQTYGETLHVLVDSAAHSSRQIEKALRKAGQEFQAIRPAPVRMEQAFISLVNKLMETQAQGPTQDEA